MKANDPFHPKPVVYGEETDEKKPFFEIVYHLVAGFDSLVLLLVPEQFTHQFP